jgi:hypothetical protein
MLGDPAGARSDLLAVMSDPGTNDSAWVRAAASHEGLAEPRNHAVFTA